MKAQELGTLIRTRREELGISQDALAASVGRSRHWLTQVERARNYNTGKPIAVSAGMLVQVARMLDLDPATLLTLAEVPLNLWPDLSNFRSNTDTVMSIDISTLSESQARLVKALVTEFKAGRTTNDNDRNGE